MEDWLLSLVPWGSNVIAGIQGLRNGPLDVFMQATTYLGNSYLFAAACLLIYWCWHKGLGARLLFLGLLSTYFNDWVKQTLQIPRPDDPRIAVNSPEDSPSFPSGHAQQTLAAAGYLGFWLRRGWVWVVAVAATLLVAFSRLYLGVHFPQDVLGGWLIGALLLAGYLFVGERIIMPWLRRLPFGAQIAGAVIIPLALLFVSPADHTGLYPGETIATICGALLGTGVGLALEQRYVRFMVDGPLTRRLLRLLVGLALVAVVYFLGKFLDFEEAADLLAGLARAIRYGLVGLACVAGAPWLFVKLGLAGRGGEP